MSDVFPTTEHQADAAAAPSVPADDPTHAGVSAEPDGAGHDPDATATLHTDEHDVTPLEPPVGAPLAKAEQVDTTAGDEGIDPTVPAEDTKEEAAAPTEPDQPPEESKKRWYVVKVQSGREESIKDAIERRVKIERLEEFFGQIVIPVERVTIMRNGKRVTKQNKLYPGYLMVEVEYNDRILYLFRETSGVGDFVGGSLTHPPQPMSDHEVQRMLGRMGKETDKLIPTKPQFDRGDRVKVNNGTFAGMEGEVKDILEAKGAVKVELVIFGRPVPVELEYWQVDHG